MDASSTRPNLRSAHDAHGNPMTGDAESIARYDRAIDRFLRYDHEAALIAKELLHEDPPVPLGAALGAYLRLVSTEPADLPAARECHAAMEAQQGNERERMHARAIGAWLRGDWVGAGDLLDEVLYRWPEDLLAVTMAHQLAFFVGDAASLRDRPLRALFALGPEHPHAGFVRGMAAFGLEESGHYAEAMDAGMAALAANPDDVWAVHAVAHTYEMRGEVDAGIRFMESGGSEWQTGNTFAVHNWWHLALFQLEAGRNDRALDIYDRQLHHDASAGAAMEMLDASALLWRLHLDQVDTGGRFAVLADAWAPKALDRPWYAFNDLHGVLALVGAGRMAEAREATDRLARWLATGAGTNVRMTREVGLPACRSIIAFGEERYDDAMGELLPIRRTLHVFGGSHAQRDVLQRTLIESALRSGRHDLARGLAAERLGVRRTSVYGWTQMARALLGLGDDPGATAAAAQAAGHRSRFAAEVP